MPNSILTTAEGSQIIDVGKGAGNVFIDAGFSKQEALELARKSNLVMQVEAVCEPQSPHAG